MDDYWIPTDVRVPGGNPICLMVLEGGSFWIGHFDTYKRDARKDGVPVRVTHWQPLLGPKD